MTLSSLRANLSRLLTRHSASFDRLARRLSLNLTADGVHDLRVLARRLRSALWTADRLGLDVRDPRRLLRKLGRTLGERRLIDVALLDAKEFRLDPAPLLDRRIEAGAAVSKRITPRRRLQLLTLLRRVARDLPSAADPERDARALADGLGRRAEALRDALAGAPRGKDELHRLRIEAKKTRYLLDTLGRSGDFLKPLQSRIGRAHDLELLQKMLGFSPAAARVEARERAAARRLMRPAVARALRAVEGLAP